MVRQAEFSSSRLPAAEWMAALQKWIDELGAVRYSKFYCLADKVVRYEIAGDSGYRVGETRQVWNNAELVSFQPLSETIVQSRKALFTDITEHCFDDVSSFREQLLQGNTCWRSRLDAATGIDIYGNNGIAVADIDGDGEDEIYVCQPAGLPNRLYKTGSGGKMQDITESWGVGVLDDTTSALFADFRNCGLQDLVVLRSSK